jgi:hypothetical protein
MEDNIKLNHREIEYSDVEENQLLKILCENCSISVAEIKLG